MKEGHPFFRCYSCGKHIAARHMKQSYMAAHGGAVCSCGSRRFIPENASFWYQILYLIFHPLEIKKTILWPTNWASIKEWWNADRQTD